MGIEVTAVDIGQIKIPAEAEERLLKRWTAQWDQQIDTTRAETEKVVQVTRATARMETVQAIARRTQTTSRSQSQTARHYCLAVH